MVDKDHVLAVIAFLVLISVLAILVAWARGRQRRFDPEKDQRRPLGRNTYLGGMLDSAGPPVATVAATFAAAMVAPSTATAAEAPTGPSQPLVAANSAVESAPPFQQMDMGDGVVAYYAERTGLPVTPGFDFDPNARTYFVFEKLTGTRENYLLWWKYVNAQQEAGEEKELTISEGTIALLRSLELSKWCLNKYDIWIAYVTNKKPTTIAERGELINRMKGAARDATGIEMLFSVLIHRETPVTTHSGIFRTFKYWKQLAGVERAEYVQKKYTDKGIKPDGIYFHEAVGHRSLSALLHAFAAAAARHVYPHLQQDGVMVTRPVPMMGKILRKGLRPGEYTIGSPEERGAAKVQERAMLYAASFGEEGFSPEVYEPALGQPYKPFFDVGVNEKTGARTWTFGDKTYEEPEWMQKIGPNSRCGHRFASIEAPDPTALEYTIRLSALAQRWNTPN